MLACLPALRARALGLVAGLLAALAAAALAAPAADAIGTDGLRSVLARNMRAAGPFAGAYVRDLDTGEALFARKAAVARPPASVEKLYTTSTALLRYGPDARLRTTVLATGALDALGVWRGDLYLKGGGDPTLGQTQIAALAAQVELALGAVRIAGRVFGDESALDALRGSARTGYAFDRDIGGVLSALAVARGFSRDGAPAKEAARRLTRALRARGVGVAGAARAGLVPVGAQGITAVDSPPIADLIRLTNVPSDNFYAETLLKDIGATFGGIGTTQTGAAVVRTQLAAFGIRPQVVDGSGLSRANLTSPRQVVTLFDAMHDQPLGPVFEGSLAVVGRTGTVSRRMRGTPAQDRCHTKTGTLRAASALAGICLTTGGHTVAFAFLMSTPLILRAHVLQDRMTAAIATYGT